MKVYRAIKIKDSPKSIQKKSLQLMDDISQDWGIDLEDVDKRIEQLKSDFMKGEIANKWFKKDLKDLLSISNFMIEHDCRMLVDCRY